LHTGSDATKSALKSISSPVILHIAMRGYYLDLALGSIACFRRVAKLFGLYFSRSRQVTRDGREVHAIASDLSVGLCIIHEAGIIHRDLKSRNIMLVDRNGFRPSRHDQIDLSSDQSRGSIRRKVTKGSRRRAARLVCRATMKSIGNSIVSMAATELCTFRSHPDQIPATVSSRSC